MEFDTNNFIKLFNEINLDKINNSSIKEHVDKLLTKDTLVYNRLYTLYNELIMSPDIIKNTSEKVKNKSRLFDGDIIKSLSKMESDTRITALQTHIDRLLDYPKIIEYINSIFDENKTIHDIIYLADEILDNMTKEEYNDIYGMFF